MGGSAIEGYAGGNCGVCVGGGGGGELGMVVEFFS